MINKIIQVSNLTKKFDQKIVLNDISFTVEEGDIYGFLGRNGSGKSTTMKAILKLLNFDAGTIEVFNGTNIQDNDEYLKQVGSLIEEPAFYPNLTGYENLKIVQKLSELPVENIDRVLSIVGLTESAHKLAKKYSLGMKQRLGIALALIKFPKILILDEPTNGLDPEGVREIRDLIKSLPKKYGITVFISSHILSEIEKMVNKVAILDHGEIKFEGDIKTLEQGKNLTIMTNNTSATEGVLASRNYKFDKEADNIIINGSSPEMAIVINKLLVDSGIGVSELHLAHHSLEDIFLSITKGV
ncbi:ABC transporter ATP-binding protein [Leuconostoc inhae]|uniref:ABC transporter ATP-binding protein n=1 Tax=Leuconostoc inhae TaxID=178001 RepID=UPI0007DED5F9|nr:ABC transporter ATP-binding protein [Leuconostoc inhae]CUW12775.1 ABC transporter ATP-binding protein [Leuconostoc inhae]